MGFSVLNFISSCLKTAVNSGQKSKSRCGELGDDYDFREEFADDVESWEEEVEELSYFADEWDEESDPKEYLKKFNEKYNNTLDFLKNTVKPFLAEHSDGYRKSDLNYIYKDLLEKAKEYKQTFIKDEYPYIVEKYKEFLEEQRIEEEERQKEEAEWAAIKQEVVEKLKDCQPIKQKSFLDEFEEKSYIKAVLNELVENEIVERVKKSGAYIICLAAPEKRRIELLNVLNIIKSQK